MWLDRRSSSSRTSDRLASNATSWAIRSSGKVRRLPQQRLQVVQHPRPLRGWLARGLVRRRGRAGRRSRANCRFSTTASRSPSAWRDATSWSSAATKPAWTSAAGGAPFLLLVGLRLTQHAGQRQQRLGRRAAGCRECAGAGRWRSSAPAPAPRDRVPAGVSDWRLMVRLAVTLPRFSALPARSRHPVSRLSQPFGSRKRSSRVRPLTLRSSHAQAMPSMLPSVRANPVMEAIAAHGAAFIPAVATDAKRMVCSSSRRAAYAAAAHVLRQRIASATRPTLLGRRDAQSGHGTGRRRACRRSG